MFATTEAHGSSSSETLAMQPLAASSLGIPQTSVTHTIKAMLVRLDGLGVNKIDQYF